MLIIFWDAPSPACSFKEAGRRACPCLGRGFRTSLLAPPPIQPELLPQAGVQVCQVPQLSPCKAPTGPAAAPSPGYNML